MIALIAEAIAADIATLTRVVPEPEAPLGYGVDLSCTDVLDEHLTEVDPASTRALGEALYRRITTPRGQLLDDQDYGLDLAGFLNRGVTQRELGELSGRISSELRKDDRVDAAAVSVSEVAPQSYRVRIRVSPADPALSPFELTIPVAGGTAMLEVL